MENKTLIIISVFAVLLVGTVVAVNLNGSGVTGKATEVVSYYCWGGSSTDFQVTTSSTSSVSYYKKQPWTKGKCYNHERCSILCNAKGYVASLGSDSKRCICSTSGCSDTEDGKDYYEAGTVTGPTGTKYLDSCNGNQLYEWSCTSQGYAAQTTFICPSGCSNGACNCMDTDGGINYATKGTIRGYGPIGSIYENDGRQGIDACTPDGELREYFCKDNRIQWPMAPCSSWMKDFKYVCRDGACVLACTDSDVDSTHSNGINYDKNGIVIDPNGVQYTDKCEGTSLREYFCKADASQAADSVYYTCPAGQTCQVDRCAMPSTAHYCWGSSATDFQISTSITKPYSWYSQRPWSNNMCFSKTCQQWCSKQGVSKWHLGQNSLTCICEV